MSETVSKSVADLERRNEELAHGNACRLVGRIVETDMGTALQTRVMLQLDEHSPRALVSVADALSGRVLDGFSDASEDDLRRAKELVSKALAINPNYSSAHALKAQILRAQKNYDAAIVEYETATSLNPMDVGSHLHLARRAAHGRHAGEVTL